MAKKLIFYFAFYFICTVFSSCQTGTSDSRVKVIIETDSGKIVLVLYDETPQHKENFIKLIKEGYYDGQLFHRLIKEFMIQGGDPNSKNASTGEMLGQGGPGYTIPAEISELYIHKKGSLGAARKGDKLNPSRASSGSQFYIVQGRVFTNQELEELVLQNIHKPFTANEILTYTTLGGSPHLDGGYTIFGEVTEGLPVLDRLMNTPVDAYDRPVTDIKFTIKIED
jgi:peptidyl-prolyl cis-trans isomerase B (cyclophilin B)